MIRLICGPPAWGLGDGQQLVILKKKRLVGSYELSNEPLGSIKGGEFLD
jgi:hypothetical protein